MDGLPIEASEIRQAGSKAPESAEGIQELRTIRLGKTPGHRGGHFQLLVHEGEELIPGGEVEIAGQGSQVVEEGPARAP